MRIFVIFENTRLTVDVQPGENVKAIKNIVEGRLRFGLQDDKRQEKVLDVVYGGASLRDDWILQDIGLYSGCTVKCALKVVEKPKLSVLLGYSGEMMHIMDEIDPITTKISEIRSKISQTLGLPVSAYRLILMKDNDSLEPIDTRKKLKRDQKVELYDCNTLDTYGLELGATIRLEVWDGWSEFVRAALLGHEKLVGQFLFWKESERHFQRRVALQIAAHFGYTGLAHAMLKAGARPDVPVGSHPTREWCGETEHADSKNCPVHVACEQGHLGILRMFLKNHILCFVVRDAKGRIPWQIVIERSHKECFEYLLARQWGRKTGKDVSFPMLTYCRIIQWCERARAKALLRYGSSKSTLRGRPIYQGALVGRGVAVDGLSTKTMTSKPLSAMPRPAIHPRRLLPALARARRRFHRQRSSAVFHGASFSQSTKSLSGMDYNGAAKGSLSRRTSSRFSLTRPITPTSNGDVFINETDYRKPDVAMNNKTKQKILKNKSNVTKGNAEAAYISTGIAGISIERNEKGDGKSDAKGRVFFPRIHPSEIPGNERHPTQSITTQKGGFKDSVTTWDGSSSRSNGQQEEASGKKRYKKPLSAKSQIEHMDMIALERTKAKIPLPSTTIPEYRKPYFYWGTPVGGDGENPVEVTLSRFETYRGKESRDNAIHCLTLANTFTEKPYLKQLNMAVCLACRGVTRDISSRERN